MEETVKPKSLRHRKYLKDRRRASIHGREVELLNQAAARLNREAEDVLECQASGHREEKKALRLALDVG